MNLPISVIVMPYLWSVQQWRSSPRSHEFGPPCIRTVNDKW